MLSSVNGWISKLTQAGVGLIGLAIVAQVIFGSTVAFLPGDVVASLMGIISSLGGAGLVGLVTAGLLYQILK
jgi:membrane protein DedA with SNARE-associated domain